MTDLFAKLEALQGVQPATLHTYRPLMDPQIDGAPTWPPEQTLEWLQQKPPHIRGVPIAMMRRVYRMERVGIPPLPQAIPSRYSLCFPTMAAPWASATLWMTWYLCTSTRATLSAAPVRAAFSDLCSYVTRHMKYRKHPSPERNPKTLPIKQVTKYGYTRKV